MLLLPVVLLMRAPSPVAVLLLPVVLLKRAWNPVAVLLLPVVLLVEGAGPRGGVGVARGVAAEGAGAQGGVADARGVAAEGAVAQGGVAVPQLLHVGEVAVDIDDQMRGDDGLHQDGPARPEPDIHGVAHILAGDKIHRRR